MDSGKSNVLNYTWYFFLWIFFLFSFLSCQQEIKEKPKPTNEVERPNVLLILTDDQAYGDLSLMGNPISETPNLDLLAKEGVFFENFYVSPVCAPTRASLLTGRYHQRTGVSGVTRGRENMNLDEVTLADILKKNGYSTGIFGKWHNGAHYPYHPLGRGFEEFVGFTSGHWSSYFDTTIEKNGKPFYAEGYLPDVLTKEAIDFIKRKTAAKQPFFCFLPYQTPHTPLQVPDKYFDKFKHKGADDFNATMYGMAENIDDHVGEILKELERLHIRENTIIIYLSDNGPMNLRYNSGLKGRKGQVDEGGMRVPFIVNWKNHIEPGLVSNYPLAHIDLLPTLTSLLGIDYTAKNALDGLDFKSLLSGSTEPESRDLYMEWGNNERVLSKDYLMINKQLYNLGNDPGQKFDIREDYPEVYDSLQVKYMHWKNNLPTEKNAPLIPVGYLDYPLSTLPAHEANLHPPFEFRKDRRHTGIAYHSLYGWAHDWIDHWTKTSAYVTWDLDIVESGTYEIELNYALAASDVGAKLAIEIDGQRIELEGLKSFKHSERPSHDRIPRVQEAPETDWNLVHAGTLHIEKGTATLKILSLEIPGEKSIELKEVLIRRIE